VFKVPVKERDRVRVDFGYTVDQSTVIFRGAGR